MTAILTAALILAPDDDERPVTPDDPAVWGVAE